VSLLGAIALTHASAAALFTLVCVYAVWRSASRSRHRAPHAGAGAPPLPRVVLLRATERVDAAFVARVDADTASYSGALRRVVCVPSLDAVRAPLGDGIAMAVSGIDDVAAVNRKAAHLEAGVARARADAPFGPGDVIVHADADVVLAPGDLDRLVASLERDAPDGASFAPPAPCGGGRLAELLARAILVASPQAFAVVWSLARLTRSEPALAGKLVAMRAATLDAIGGYAATAWAIADDIALVAALRARGGRIALAPFAARTVAPHRTLRDVASQMTRWMRVVGAHRPALLGTYPLLVAPVAVSTALAFAAALGGEILPVCALGALVASRVALAVALGRGAYRGQGLAGWASPLGAVLGDAVLLGAVVAAVWPAPITWSGRRYDVGASGRILRVRRAPRAPFPPGARAPGSL
jgi:hypothetical protein